MYLLIRGWLEAQALWLAYILEIVFTTKSLDHPPECHKRAHIKMLLPTENMPKSMLPIRENDISQKI